MTIQQQIEQAIQGMKVDERAIFYAIIAKCLIRDDAECADFVAQAAVLARAA